MLFRKIVTWAIAALALPVFAGEPEQSADPTDRLIDSIPVVVLDDSVVLQSGDLKVPTSAIEKVELAYAAAEKRRQPKFTLTPELKSFLRKRFAFRFMANALVEKYVADNKLEIAKDKFEEQFSMFKKTKAEENNAGSYEQWLADNGLSDDEFRRFWSANWAIEQNFAKSVTDADVELAISKQKDNMGLRRASHILVMNKGAEPPQQAIFRTKEEAKTIADDVLKKLKAGADFLKLVKSVSDCPSKADNGDLGYIARKGGPTDVFGEMFNEGVYKLEKAGDMSAAPIESKFGYHVIRLDDVRKPEDLKTEMRQFLISEKYRKQMEQLMNAAAANAKFNSKQL